MSKPSLSTAAKSAGARSIADPKAARARLRDIIEKRSFGRGEITLASGRKSDFYFNLKPTMLAPEELDYIGGLELGAVPVASAVAALSALRGNPLHAFFVRKKPKEHGAKLLIEGLAKDESLAGKRVAVIEDVTTTGGSAMKAVETVQEAGAEVALVFTMVDRQEGAAEAFSAAGLRFQALFTAEEFLRR
jgi:orotate phosphoribosyltransferase